MKISQQQIAAVLALPGPVRYSHFIKRSADARRVWGLFSGGWALAATADETPVFPVWPAREYAALCATGDWSEYEPRDIGLDDFFAWLLPKLREDGTLLGVFYSTTG